MLERSEAYQDPTKQNQIYISPILGITDRLVHNTSMVPVGGFSFIKV